MGSPLRILHVVVNMNRGGAETLIMNLYRNIDRTKVQFDFLTCKPGVFDSEIEAMGGRVYRVPYISEVGHFKFIHELELFFSTHADYKIVHSHLDKMSGFVLRSAKKAGIPIRISHSHSSRSEGGYASRVYKYYAGSLIGKNATNYIACSNHAAKWLFRRKSYTTTILKNGIESEKFEFSPVLREEVRRELNIGDSTFVLGHVGRFSNVKNHSFLIEIFFKYNLNKPDTVLVLVGDGLLKEEMRKKVRDLNLEKKVIFTGVRSDINRLLQAFDLFVLPSIHEGLPVSLIEAQSTGLPCIISDHITREVDLGLDLIKYVPLEKSDLWVVAIEKHTSTNNARKSNKDIIQNKGYEIKFTAQYLKDYYLTLAR